MSYSWFPIGQRLTIAYEAPQGRRVNALGAYFSHGPCAGRLAFETYASLPKSRARKPRKSLADRVQQHALTPEEVGTIDAACFIRFVWRVAGREPECLPDWKRERPLFIVMDNYSVHRSQVVQEEVAAWAAADVYLLYLPSYAPELSRIEPIWQDIKYHEMSKRSYPVLGELKQAVEDALQRKADKMLIAHTRTGHLLQQAA